MDIGVALSILVPLAIGLAVVLGVLAARLLSHVAGTGTDGGGIGDH